MRWLSDDRGATAVVTAISMVALVGMAAFAVDVGALYQERRELQNGADASALAVAEDCASGLPSCSWATASADSYGDANASDSAANVVSASVDTAARTVAVTLQTEDASGVTALAPFFAQVLGLGSSTVQAKATAAWGHPRDGWVLPLIISECEWGDPPPLQEPPWSGSPTVFYFHGSAAAATCEHHTSGFDLPGGFGWLETAGACAAWVKESLWAPDDPGASPPADCSPAQLREDLLGKTVLLPYYDELKGLGTNIEYKVLALGAFHVTGYNFGGGYKEAAAGHPIPCSGSERCLAGYQTTKTVYDGDLGGGDRGVTLVKLTG